MSLYIDPVSLEGQQLVLKPTGAADYAVRILDRSAGPIMLRQLAGNRVSWLWTVTGPYIPADLQPSHGEADTLREAKVEFRAKFDAWLSWATALGHPVMWTG